MADSVMFDADSARRIGEAVRRMEASGLGGPTGDNPQRRPADPIQILKITGSVSSGLYPAKVSWWNDGAAVESLSEEVRWKPRDGSTPAVNDYVWGRYAGPVADGSKGLYVGCKEMGGGFTGTQVVVTDVSWNSTTCVMTKTTKTITFVSGIVTGIA